MSRIIWADDGRIALFWRLFTYFILFIDISLVANLVNLALTRFGSPPLLAESSFAVTYILGVFLLTKFYRRRLDRRSWSGMALPPLRESWHHITVGLLSGGFMTALVFGIEYLAGWVHIVGSEVNIIGLSASILLLLAKLISFIAVGFVEELSIRGYLFQNLGERYPIWLATIVTGVFFGLLHYSRTGFGVASVVSMIIWSSFLVITRLQTKSIWIAIGHHTAWNWVQISVLGLNQVGKHDYGHALLHLEQHGPPLWVGKGFLVENGVLYMFVLLQGFLTMLIWGWHSKRTVDWRAKLKEDGSVVRV